MIVQQFFKLLIQIIIAFQCILAGFYFVAFGWQVGLISIGVLIAEVVLYQKKLYKDIEASYVVFNVFTMLDMYSSIALFGNGLGFES